MKETNGQKRKCLGPSLVEDLAEHMTSSRMPTIISRSSICYLATLSALSAPCVAVELPNGVLRLLPDGYSLMTYAPGDLNKDGREDYVVALRGNTEDDTVKSGQPAPKRPLFVFLQNDSGTYATFSRNDDVVLAADQGGQCDPFPDGEEGIVVKASYFTVQNSVACGHHWTDYITFRFAPEHGGIVFHKRIIENWIMNPTPSASSDALVLEKRRVFSAKKDKPVHLEKYRP